MHRALLLLCTILVLGTPTWGVEGSIPIYQPTTISASGHFVVTRDFVAGGTGITITASDVTLDLNGHSINSQGILLSDGTTRITIRGGRLIGGGISSPYTNRTRIHIEGVSILTPVGVGIFVGNAEEIEITSCNISDAASHGIRVESAVPSRPGRGRILNNSITSNGRGIYLVGMSGGEIRGNLVRTVGNSGIDLNANVPLNIPCSGNRVEANVLDGRDTLAYYRGLSLENCDNTLVKGNATIAWYREGIYVLGNRNRVTQNQVLGNGGGTFSGIAITGTFNTIDDNISQGNSAYGLYLFTAGENIYRDNVFRGNTLGPIFGAAGNIDGLGNI